MGILRISVVLIIVVLLTVVTQVGGVVFLISVLTYRFIDRIFPAPWIQFMMKMISFVIVYLIFTFAIVPPIAKLFGRVPLPVIKNGGLQPANILTCILNRHYVRVQLKEVVGDVSKEMSRKFPGATVNYLDANFPFINGFPLMPHLSHSDGKKLDLSFQYNDSQTGKISNSVPSFIGYGICEEPMKGEEDKPADCRRKGYWQYSLLKEVVPQGNKEKYTLDDERTSELVNSLASHGAIGKIFLEPHLKTRLNLSSSRIRFHGCQAVRHDDHIHVQLK